MSNEHVRNKVLAVDISIWLTQFVKAMRDAEGAQVRNAHLLGVFRRCIKLLFLSVRPVLVFDGATPALKRRTLASRRAQREKHAAKLRRLAEKMLLNQMRQHVVDATISKKGKRENRSKPTLHSPGRRLEERQASAREKGGNVNFDEDIIEPLVPKGPSVQAGQQPRQNSSSQQIDSTHLEEDNKGKIQMVLSSGEKHAYADRQTGADQVRSDGFFAADLADEEERRTNNQDSEMLALPDDVFEIDDEAVGNLPPNVQADVFKQIKSRQRAKHRERMMLKQRDPSEFSRTQIEGFLQFTALNRKILSVRKAINSKSGASQRIASDSNRRFILDENQKSASNGGKLSESDDDDMLLTHKRRDTTERPPTDILARIRASRDQTQTNEREQRRHLKQAKHIESQYQSGVGWASKVLEGKGGLSLGRKSVLQPSEWSRSDASFDAVQSEADLSEDSGSLKDNAGGREALKESREDDDDDDDIEWEDGDNHGEAVKYDRPVSNSKSPAATEEDRNLNPARPQGIPVISIEEDEDHSQKESQSENEHVALLDIDEDDSSDENRGLDVPQNNEREQEDTKFGVRTGNGNDFDANKSRTVSLCHAKDGIRATQLALEQTRSIQDVKTGSKDTSEHSRHVPNRELISKESSHGVSSDQEATSQEVLETANVTLKPIKVPGKDDERPFNSRPGHVSPMLRSRAGQAKLHDEGVNNMHSNSEFLIGNETAAKTNHRVNLPESKMQRNKRLLHNTGLRKEHMSPGMSSEANEPPHVSRKRKISQEEEERDIQLAIARSLQEKSSEENTTTIKSRESPRATPAGKHYNSVTRISNRDSPSTDHANSSQRDGNSSFLASGKSGQVPKPRSVHFSEVINKDELRDASSMPTDEAKMTSRESQDEKAVKVSEFESRHFEATEISEERLKELRDELNMEAEDIKRQRHSEQGAAESVSDEMYAETRDLLKLFGIPYLEAPTEAEAQCAYLNMKNVVDGIITEDSDAFLFGAKTIYRRLFSEGRFAEAYESEDIKNSLGLDREMLIRLAYLLGSDYTSGVRGVGVVNSMEILEAFPGEQGLEEFREWMKKVSIFDEEPDQETLKGKSQKAVRRRFCWKHRNMKRNWEVREGFPNIQVAEAYRRPDVNTSTEKFKWGNVNFSGLAQFCWDKFGWEYERFRDATAPLQKKLSEESGPQQRRIDEFFKPHRFAKIRSERLQHAVKGIAGEEAKELMSTLQPRAKRRKVAPVAHLPTVLSDEEEAMVEALEKAENSRKRIGKRDA